MGIREFFDSTPSIDGLKKKAAYHYQAYHRACDRYSCGRTIAEEVSPEVSNHRQKFNEYMEQLALIDPSCPATRL